MLLFNWLKKRNRGLFDKTSYPRTLYMMEIPLHTNISPSLQVITFGSAFCRLCLRDGTIPGIVARIDLGHTDTTGSSFGILLRGI